MTMATCSGSALHLDSSPASNLASCSTSSWFLKRPSHTGREEEVTDDTADLAPGRFFGGNNVEAPTLSLLFKCLFTEIYKKNCLFTALFVKWTASRNQMMWWKFQTSVPTTISNSSLEESALVRRTLWERVTVNYTNIVRKRQGPTLVVVRYSKFFRIFLLRNVWTANNQWQPSEASTLFPCSSSFQSFKSLQRHLNYGQCENKTTQESVYYQLLCDWVARFTSPLPENRPRAKSGVSSVTSSSLPLWDGRFKG